MLPHHTLVSFSVSQCSPALQCLSHWCICHLHSTILFNFFTLFICNLNSSNSWITPSLILLRDFFYHSCRFGRKKTICCGLFFSAFGAFGSVLLTLFDDGKNTGITIFNKLSYNSSIILTVLDNIFKHVTPTHCRFSRSCQQNIVNVRHLFTF